MKNLIYLVLAVMLFSCNSQQNKPNPCTELKGEYLGQQIPEDSAVLFAPGIVSTGITERDFAITPDGNEIFFTRTIGRFNYSVIYHVIRKDNEWSEPEIFKYCTNGNYKYTEPFVTIDGKKLLFVSNQPVEGEVVASFDIWVSEKDENNNWQKPYNLGAPVNTSQNEFFPTMTKEGTIYFNHFDSVAQDEFIYRSRLVNGKYTEPEKLNEKVNGGRARFNAFIATDESFIIVPTFGYADSYGATDYYIVFCDENDNWSEPMNMGNQINSADGQEWSASLSPDGKYLFFMSSRIPESKPIDKLDKLLINELHNSPQNGNPDIYWMSTDFIKDLRAKAVFN